MTTFRNNLRNRPRLTVSVGVAAVVLALLTLIPFTFDRPVGYEVAVAGVDKSLATDGERVSALLAALGLEGASVDVTDCAQTCKLVIRELQTQADADLVAAAFSCCDDTSIACTVAVVVSECSGSLLNHAKNAIVVRGDAGNSEITVHDILVNRLGKDCGGNALTWMKCLTDSLPGCCPGAGGGKMSAEPITMTIHAGSGSASEGHPCSKAVAGAKCDSIKTCMMICGAGDGRLPEALKDLKLEAGEVDENLVRQLEERGFRVVIDSSMDGQAKMIKIQGVGSPDESGVGEEDQRNAKEAAESGLPYTFDLAQNYPNPFNPSTTIGFSLPETQHVTLDIFNVQGRKVRTLVDDVREAGPHTVDWNATADDGSRVASGVYLYRLKAGNQIQTKKMTLVK